MTDSPHQNRSSSRLQWISRAVVLIALVLAGRAFTIQVIKDERLERIAKKQFQSKMLIRPRRGSVVDRNGEALAVNVETQSLAANPNKLRKRKDILRLISKSLDLPIEKFQQKFKEKREFTWIKRHLSESEVNLLKKWQIIAADGDLVEGLWIVRESKRVYPHHDLAAHVLGDTNVDAEGTEGVELWLNTSLKGSVVSMDTTRDALGRATFLDVAAAGSVKDGQQVKLTLDASLQFAVEQELKLSVAKTGARGGSVIVMNATNGELLAMANEPSFDPNFDSAPLDHRRNRVLTDGYEPGSTLKPLLLATALSKGMSLKDQIWGNRGSFTVQGKKISEAEAYEKFEWITLKKMIQVSSNVASAKLALKLGADSYSKLLQQSGFGAKTGVGFPGEISGKLPPRKSWQPLTLANIGFGQGLLVTPLQMVRAYASFLNGGWLVQPTLILEGDSSKPLSREAPRRIFSQTVAEQVQEALSAVVSSEEGTGSKARLSGYEVAGKTGTAQTVDPITRRYSKSRFISSFIGFARGVEPKLVIYTAVDGPKGVYYASETAAPLFQRVLQAVVNRFSIPADPRWRVEQPSSVVANRQSDAISLQASAATASAAEPALIKEGVRRDPLKWDDTSGAQSQPGSVSLYTMPSLMGLSAREALRALQGQPFHIEIVGQGLVRSQAPEPGKPIAEQTPIRLSLGL